MACTPSYSTQIVAHDSPPCNEICAGVTFSVESITTGNDREGQCTFEWNVTRSNGLTSTTLSGSTTVPCGGNKTVDLHCDSGGGCVGFRIHLSCEED